MLFEEKVVNFLRPQCGTSGKAERQLFNHKRQMSMISNSDFEKLWVLYKTEGEPQGVSIVEGFAGCPPLKGFNILFGAYGLRRYGEG